MKLRQLLISLACLISSQCDAQPVIDSIIPSSSRAGISVIIRGKNFSSTASDNVVFFGRTRALVISSTPTSMFVNVPINASYGSVTVTTNMLMGHFYKPFNLIDGEPLDSNSFAARSIFPTAGRYASSVAVSDLNEDGKPDHVISDFNSSTVSIFRNRSVPGTIDMYESFPLPTRAVPEGLAIGNLTGDEKPDLVVACITGRAFSVFRNISVKGGPILFSTRVDIPATGSKSPRGIAIGDINGDGKADVIVADNNKIYGPNNEEYGTVTVYENRGDLISVAFSPIVELPTGEYPRRCFVADIDGDQRNDIVIVNHILGTLTVYRNTTAQGRVSFAGRADYPIGTHAEQVCVGDIDGDGKPDVVASSLTGSKVVVYRNNSTPGNILLQQSMELPANQPLGLTLADVNGDGRPDLLVANMSARNVSVFTNTSEPGIIRFAGRRNFDAGAEVIDISVGDLDGDGIPEISLTTGERDALHILYKKPPPLALDLGDDKSLCAGDSATIQSNIAAEQYLWSTGDTGSALVVREPGLYWLEATRGNLVMTDTVEVRIAHASALSLGNDTVLCQGEALTLRPGIAADSYAWSNGSANSELKIENAGTYWVKARSGNCELTDTIVVEFRPAPQLTLERAVRLCEGQETTLLAGGPGPAYLWNTGDTSRAITINAPGAFTVRAEINGCIARDSITVQRATAPVISLLRDTILCRGQDLILSAAVTDGQLQWQDGSGGADFRVTQPGTYRVTATNTCGTSHAFTVVKQVECELVLPNAFSPNGDGTNDYFRIPYPQYIRTFQMQVFNRWGQLVYVSNDAATGWDGTHLGRQQPAGTYVYLVVATDISGRSLKTRGTVMLIR